METIGKIMLSAVLAFIFAVPAWILIDITVGLEHHVWIEVGTWVAYTYGILMITIMVWEN